MLQEDRELLCSEPELCRRMYEYPNDFSSVLGLRVVGLLKCNDL